MNRRALLLTLTLGLIAGAACAGDWAPECSGERYSRWWRPDQRRGTLRDEPEEHHPHGPHQRIMGAGRHRGYPPPCNEETRRRELAAVLSPETDEVGYRGLCELHHSGPPCIGDPRPLPEWVPDNPDACAWPREIESLRTIGRSRRRTR